MSDPCATPTTVPATGPTTPWWKHLVTCKDNQTWDLGKVSWLTCTGSALAKEAWQMSQGKGTALRDFCTALAVIAAAHGAALGFKSRTEPGGDA